MGGWDLRGYCYIRGVPSKIWVKIGIFILIKKISPAALKGLLYFCFGDENCKIIACGALWRHFVHFFLCKLVKFSPVKAVFTKKKVKMAESGLKI